MPLIQDRVDPTLYTDSDTKASYQFIDEREDDFYDTQPVDNGAITADHKIVFFDGKVTKRRQHSNVRKAREIAANNNLILTRVGVHFCQAIGNTLLTDDDAIKLAHGGFLELRLDDRLVTEGPLYKYPTGYGLTGSTTRNDTGVVTNGVASAAAAPTLIRPHLIDAKKALNAEIQFGSLTWTNDDLTDFTTTMPSLDGECAISLFLHGLVTRPITS